jgi:hypothetical protein
VIEWCSESLPAPIQTHTKICSQSPTGLLQISPDLQSYRVDCFPELCILSKFQKR